MYEKKIKGRDQTPTCNMTNHYYCRENFMKQKVLKENATSASSLFKMNPTKIHLCNITYEDHGQTHSKQLKFQ